MRTKIIRRRTAVWMSMLSMAALVSTACSGGGGNAAGSAGEVDPNGVLKYGYYLNVTGGIHFDPASSLSPGDMRRMPLVFGSLMQEQPNGSYQPWMTQNVAVVDSKTVKITLRPGITFTDGSAYDANAVRTSLLRTRFKPASAAVTAGLDPGMKALSSVDVSDPLTATAHLDQPIAGEFIAAMAGRGGVIVSPKQVAEHPDQIDTHPVGAGPYALVEDNPGQLLSFRKNAAFWDAANWKLGGIDIVNAPAGAQEANGLLAGNLDFAADVPVDSTSALKGGNFRTTPITAGFFDILYMNDAKPPLDNEAVRQAVQVAIDRSAYDKITYGGQGKPAVGYYPDGSPNLDPGLKNTVAYDPAKAQQILAAAGVKNVTVDLYYTAQLNLTQQAQVLQAQLAKVGITANLISSNESAGLVSRHTPGILLSRSTLTGLAVYTAQYAAGGGGNMSGTEKPEVLNPVYQASALAPDDPRSAADFQQAGRAIAQHAYNIPVDFAPVIAAWNSSKVGGQPQFGGNTGYLQFNSIYLKK